MNVVVLIIQCPFIFLSWKVPVQAKLSEWAQEQKDR